MTDETADIRTLLLEAFRREGIEYPADRLDEAVEDCTHLHGFLAVIRADAGACRDGSDG